MENLAIDEKVRLFELLQEAVDHHDPAKPEKVSDLRALAGKAETGILQALLAAIFSNPEILSSLFGKLFGGKKPEAADPNPPAQTPATAPPVVTAPAPAVISPEQVILKLHTILGPGRTGSAEVPYHLDGDSIVLDGSTTSLDDKSTIWFDLDVIGSDGKGMRIDIDPAVTPTGQVNHPELLGRQVYIAEDVATGEELGRIGGRGLRELGHSDNGVSFVPDRYAVSGGMAVNARIKRKGGPIRIYAEVGDAESNSFQTPAIR